MRSGYHDLFLAHLATGRARAELSAASIRLARVANAMQPAFAEISRSVRVLAHAGIPARVAIDAMAKMSRAQLR